MWLLFAACASPPSPSDTDLGQPRDLVALVDPRIGTGGLGYSVGCAYPGAAWPRGLVKASPDTAAEGGAAPGFYHGGGYHSNDAYVQGFSHLHGHGIGVAAYGVVALMPTDGMDESKTEEAGYRLRFSQEEETARPGFYAVPLSDEGGAPVVDVSLAATTHTALHHYAFHDVAEPTVLLDLAHVLDGGTPLGASVSLDPETGRLSGWMDSQGGMGPAFRTWFAGIVDPLPSAWGTWSDAAPVSGATEGAGVSSGAFLSFSAQEISVRLALSLVDADGALANLEAEHEGFDVQTDAELAWAAWASRLDPVRVWGGDDDEAVIFATALYHSLLMPTSLTDVDGRYPGFDGQIHTADGFDYASDLSLWDTYRTLHPLYSLVWPSEQESSLRSLARMAEQGGALPRWPLATGDGGSMLGTPASILVGESWQKGLLSEENGDPHPDWEVLAAAALDVATGRLADPPYGGRPAVSWIDTLGYYPSDQVGASVAWTQETAIADAALISLAGIYGEDGDAATLAAHAQSWENLYDPAVGFFHARLSDGSFSEDFDEESWADEYTEGNARQYLWLVLHDPEGLIETFGGEDAFVARLEDFFESSANEDEEFWPRRWYWHGNEPDLHAPWLFALAGRPDLSRTWVDWVARSFYGTGADGLAGNDDAGTLSAWYALTSMGLYPLAGTDRYVLGAPRFDRLEIPRGEGVLTITTDPDLDALLLDGQAWDSPTLTHDRLGAGATIEHPVWP